MSDERKIIDGKNIKKALLQYGSTATPDDFRKRFETFLNDRCKGKERHQATVRGGVIS